MQRILYVLIGLLAILSIILFMTPDRHEADQSIIINNVSDQVVFMQASRAENIQKWLPGDARLTVTEATPVKSVVATGLLGGVEGKSILRFGKANNGVKVSWRHEGTSDRSPIAKLKGLFQSNSLAAAIQESLGQLRGASEKVGFSRDQAQSSAPAASINGLAVQRIQYPGQDFVVARKRLNIREMPGHFAKYFPLIFSSSQYKEMIPKGNPAALFYDWDEQGGMADIAAAIPVDKAVDIDAEMKALTIPAQQAIMVEFKGNPDNISQAHLVINQYMDSNGLRMKPPTIEEYITDPEGQQDPNKAVTKVIAFFE